MPWTDPWNEKEWSDFDHCKTEMQGEVDDPAGYCSKSHKEATGRWPSEGKMETLLAASLDRKARTLRFAVVSDSHWGSNRHGDLGGPIEEVEDYEKTHEKAAETLNNIPDIDFLVCNGDQVSDDGDLHEEYKEQFLDELYVDDIYAAFGNHDWTTEPRWEDLYGHPKDYYWESDGFGFIIAGTGLVGSDDHGPSANADKTFIQEAIDDIDSDRIFGFQHIPPTTELQGGNDMEAVREQWRRDPVEGVFVGHGHDDNSVHEIDGISFSKTELIGNARVDVQRGVQIVDVYETKTVTRQEAIFGSETINEEEL